MRPPIVETEQSTSAGSMKQSVSMTSLPPSNGQQEISDMGLAKLRLERPYNSLKVMKFQILNTMLLIITMKVCRPVYAFPFPFFSRLFTILVLILKSSFKNCFLIVSKI